MFTKKWKTYKLCSCRCNPSFLVCEHLSLGLLLHHHLSLGLLLQWPWGYLLTISLKDGDLFFCPLASSSKKTLKVWCSRSMFQNEKPFSIKAIFGCVLQAQKININKNTQTKTPKHQRISSYKHKHKKTTWFNSVLGHQNLALGHGS